MVRLYVEKIWPYRWRAILLSLVYRATTAVLGNAYSCCPCGLISADGLQWRYAGLIPRIVNRILPTIVVPCLIILGLVRSHACSRSSKDIPVLAEV